VEEEGKDSKGAEEKGRGYTKGREERDEGEKAERVKWEGREGEGERAEQEKEEGRAERRRKEAERRRCRRGGRRTKERTGEKEGRVIGLGHAHGY